MFVGATPCADLPYPEITFHMALDELDQSCYKGGVEFVFDLVIKNGTIIDGTGKEPFRSNLGVKNGTIVGTNVADDSQASRIIDAKGLIVAPGFIDTHSHSELRLMASPIPEAKLRQGITTEILGQDGLSVAPLNQKDAELYQQLLAGLLGSYPVDWTWSSIHEYMNRLVKHGLPVNVSYLVPHGMLRILAMGMEDRHATSEEIKAMKGFLTQAMEDGALGLSTGMIYPPCSYAPDEELVELTAVVAKFGGSFVIHMRNEGQWLLESVKQTLDICRKSGAALHISHFKSFGKANWHKPQQVLEMINAAATEGMSVTADQYPYTAGSTVLTACLPQWTLAGGTKACLERLSKERNTIKEWFQKDITIWDNRSISIGWDNIVLSSVQTSENKWVEGLSLAEVARRRDADPVDALCDLLIEEKLAITQIMFYGCEENIVTYMKYPKTMICTDGIYGGRPHPRLYGSFPRVLGLYVREKGLMPLEQAVHKMTGLPAKTFGLHNRGVLAEGYAADIVVFDPDTIADTATYEQPEQYPQGIPYVVVNGQIAIDNGSYSGTLAGQWVKHR